MQFVLLLKIVSLLITLLATIYCGVKFAATFRKRHEMLLAGITTAVTRISLRRAVRMEGTVFLVLLSLLGLSACSSAMPIAPVWNAIGVAQRRYWIAAVIDRAFVAALFLRLTYRDKLDREEIVELDRLRARSEIK